MHVIFPSFSGAPVLLSNVKSLCEYAIKYQIKAKNVHPQNVAMKYAGKTNRHGISIFLFCFVLERSMQISIDTMVLTGLRLQNEKKILTIVVKISEMYRFDFCGTFLK